MKLKEILLNKWAWVGAIIGGLLSIFNTNYLPRYLALYKLTCGMEENSCFIKDNYQGLIIMILGGFILGLIANKLWRKFK